ncbi:hypothetical protein AX774_g2119 [Zancudomyces culisetae]|uniref:Uncharacterized protein n=1 Tax=Zancudomyces culisetae TaxID=1213189 RepID=A0A1R1PTZ1_ZANCU|nr:hypothetical protein AX774_g2119 [Zancudomyces culisetae]|eukprot:OMH84362.1 hypothetical protein AX774_g2119 [Zancudomyces culisetae]
MYPHIYFFSKRVDGKLVSKLLITQEHTYSEFFPVSNYITSVLVLMKNVGFLKGGGMRLQRPYTKTLILGHDCGTHMFTYIPSLCSDGKCLFESKKNI